MSVGFTVRGSCAASALKFIDKVDCKVSGTRPLNIK